MRCLRANSLAVDFDRRAETAFIRHTSRLPGDSRNAAPQSEKDNEGKTRFGPIERVPEPSPSVNAINLKIDASLEFQHKFEALDPESGPIRPEPENILP